MVMITIESLDKSEQIPAYCAAPAGPPRAAIIVIQEIFGVNPGIRRLCDRWAEQGYLAIAPALFWRLEPDVALDPDIPEQFKHALDLMNRFMAAGTGVSDLEATIREARRRLPEAGKVGCVGYCLGGTLAYLTAARTDIDASVGYYGVGIDGLLGEKHAISRPLMLHIAGADHFVDSAAQKRIHEGLDDHPRVTIHDYPGIDHGFATESGRRRREDAARLADGRTADFFAQHIG